MSSKLSMPLGRLELVEALVEFKMPVDETIGHLSNFEFDFHGEPIVMHSGHLRHALMLFLEGQVSSLDLQNWAEALEFRDDVKVLGRSEEESTFVGRALLYLANPELDDQNQVDVVKRTLSELDAWRVGR
jgi:hypothetical protein